MKGGAFESKYGKVLTVLLVIIVIAAVALFGVLAVNFIGDYNDGVKSAEAAEQFEKTNAGNGRTSVSRSTNSVSLEEDAVSTYLDQSEIYGTKSTTASSSSGSKKKVQMYEGFPMIGTIEIPSTKIKYPILSELSKASIEKAIAVMYPSDPELNTVGNTVLVGHNYRDGRFFSNNKKLKVGDKIYISDLDGNKVAYKIYKTFITTPEDFSFGTRDTAGKREISLSTCTDDVKSRLIILASAD